MKDTVISKTKNLISSAKAKAIALISMMIATIVPTYCEADFKGTLNKVTDLVFTITTWGGIIMIVIGIIMVGKAIMDSTSGNAQPGAMGKALGVLILGVLMVAAKSLLTLLGVSATI